MIKNFNPQAYLDGFASVNPQDVDESDYLVAKAKKQMSIASWMVALQSAIANADSLATLKQNIPNLFSELPDKELIQQLEQYRILANLAGQSAILDLDAQYNLDAEVPNWLNLPFDAAIAYFRRKVIIPNDQYAKWTALQHDWAFTVAGLAKADALNDAYNLVDAAIADGADFEEFKENWNKTISNQFSDKRIYTVLDTNIRRAYAAGRYQQANDPDILARNPWRVWIHRDSRIPRPNHLALHRKAIPATHPFWKIATPNCSWGCRCSFLTASDRTLKTFNATILNNPPDPKTIADPSFQIAPGSSPQQEKKRMVEESSRGLAAPIKSKVL
jgi:hypothetical protein